MTAALRNRNTVASKPYDFDQIRRDLAGREVEVLYALGINPPQHGHSLGKTFGALPVTSRQEGSDEK